MQLLTPRTSLFLCLLLAAGFVLGQAERVLYLENFGTSDGLPQSLVYDIIEDHDGFIWVGTKDGMARFDGVEFDVFHREARKDSTFSSNDISSLYEDKEGYLWAYCVGDGLVRVDPRTGTVLHAKGNYEFFGTDLNEPSVNIFPDTRENGLWIQTFNKLGYLDLDSWPLTVTRPEAIFSSLQLPTNHCQTSIDEHGNLWYRTSGASGVFERRYENGTCSFSQRELGLDDDAFLIKDKFTGAIAYHTGRTLTLYPNNDPSHHGVEYQLPAQLNGAQIRLLHSGVAWVLEEHSGILKRWTLSTGEVDAFKTICGNTQLGANIVSTLPVLIDANGNMWLRSPGHGLFRINRHAFEFSYLPITDATQHTVDAHYTQNGYLKLGAVSPFFANQLDLVNRKSPIPAGHEFLQFHWRFSYHDITNRAWSFFGANDKLEQNFGYWIGGEFHQPDWGLKTVRDIRPGHDSTIWFIERFDSQAGTQRLVQIDAQTLQILNEISIHNLNRHMRSNEIHTWMLGPNKDIWTATKLGLWHIPASCDEVRKINNNPNDLNALPASEAFSLCPDPRAPTEAVYIGTNGGGLSHLHIPSGRIFTITTDDGLPNNVIYSILSDSLNRLWMGTNNGLALYDPATGSKRQFGLEDGTSGNEFNRNQSAILSDGRFAFGGVLGTTMFNPLAEVFQANQPETFITSVKLGNGSSPMSFSALQNSEERFKLPMYERSVDFHFTSNDLTKPEAQRFDYILLGYNYDWITGVNNRSVRYTNLDPGYYTFRVTRAGGNRTNPNDYTEFAFQVLTPWYATWWFRILLVIIIASAVYLMYQARLKHELKLRMVRQQIARDLHDEVGSTLSSISLFTTVMGKKADEEDQEVKDLLERITNNSTSAQESMNDIVWAINDENDSAVHLIQRMHRFANNLTEGLPCQVLFDIDESINDLRLNMKDRKNIYLLFKEAVNNAVKHAQCSQILVTLKPIAENYLLSIADNGVGMQKPNKDNNLGGNGLLNMRRRAAELSGTLKINADHVAGTCISVLFKLNTSSLTHGGKKLSEFPQK